MVDIWLPYGGTEVHARVPSENLMGIIMAREEVGVKDAAHEINNAITEAELPKKLVEAIRQDGKIVLALNITDVSLAKLIVSSVMRQIEELCTKRHDVTVLLANNPFAPKATNITERLEEEISQLGVKVAVNDPISNVYVCDTQGGVKIHLNKMFYEANVRVMASAVEPNPYTLYDCCECGIAFGLTSAETIKNILIPVLDDDDLQGKLFERAVEISRAAKVDFSISVIRNMRGEVTGCIVGAPEDVLRKSISLADSMYRVAVGQEADIVIISPGGAPFDNNLLMACMCLENAIKIAKRDGAIIFVAECSEGYGELSLHQMVRKAKGDLKQFEELLKNYFSIKGFILYRFLRTLKISDVFMVSAIPNYYVLEMPRLKVFRTLNEALNNALGKLGTKAKIAVVPNGNRIVPTSKE